MTETLFSVSNDEWYRGILQHLENHKNQQALTELKDYVEKNERLREKEKLLGIFNILYTKGYLKDYLDSQRVSKSKDESYLFLYLNNAEYLMESLFKETAKKSGLASVREWYNNISAKQKYLAIGAMSATAAGAIAVYNGYVPSDILPYLSDWWTQYTVNAKETPSDNSNFQPPTYDQATGSPPNVEQGASFWGGLISTLTFVPATISAIISKYRYVTTLITFPAVVADVIDKVKNPKERVIEPLWKNMKYIVKNFNERNQKRVSSKSMPGEEPITYPEFVEFLRQFDLSGI